MGETARGTRGHNAYGSPPINDILILLYVSYGVAKVTVTR
jgi:hypothetical protein